MVLGNILKVVADAATYLIIWRNQMSIKSEFHPLEDLTLFSGNYKRMKTLILVTGKRMAVSTDFGQFDPWRNKLVSMGYIYEPLDLSEYTDLEKVW